MGVVLFIKHFQNKLKSIKELKSILNSTMNNLDLLDVDVQLNILKLLKAQISSQEGNLGTIINIDAISEHDEEEEKENFSINQSMTMDYDTKDVRVTA